MSDWTFYDIPDQDGRTAIVTGANTGIGYETALALARKGAHVVMACRDERRGAEALRRLESARPVGSAELMLLDLADLGSVRAFAEAFLGAHSRLDLLINNAGVMLPPESRTTQGYELQWGVNVLGHFALTGLLLDRTMETPASRVVTVSSIAHRRARIDFDNLRIETGYSAWREYGQSKLGNLVFTLELQRRLSAAGSETASLAAHPGFSATELSRHLPGIAQTISGLWSNTPAVGALPTLYAATAPGAQPGSYTGPDGVLEAVGHPAPATIKPQARDRRTAERLWTAAQNATGVAILDSVPA